MQTTINGLVIESDDPALFAAAVIRSFGDEPDIEVVRAAAVKVLNDWRGQQRLALGLTNAKFQELVYTGKALEAQRWMAAQETPFRMAAEATQRGITNLEMAQWVLSQWDALQNGSDQIEAAYVDFQQQVEASTAVEQIESILASLQ